MARGRPISFDKNDTLETALHLFWKAGYLGTSYTDLCAATGLTKPSLYGAYGNKETTFLAALHLYVERFIRPGVDMLAQEAVPREAISKLLLATVEGLTADGTPPGCMIAANIACLGSPDIPVSVADALGDALKKTPTAILQCLSRAAPKELPPHSSPPSLALYFEAVISGLSGLARQGSARQELVDIVEIAMSIWPVNPETSAANA